MIKNSSNNYGTVAKALHWSIALLIFTLFAVGIYMTGLTDNDPSRSTIYGLHKASGTLVIVLSLFRLLWVVISPPPAAPAALAKVDRIIHKSVVGLLYLLILAVPLAGFFMSQFFGYGVDFFGAFEIPVIVGKNEEIAEFFEQSHELLAFIIIGLAALHMLGALKHRLKDRNGETDVLKRML